MRTVFEFLEYASEKLAQNDVFLGHGTDNYWDEAVLMVIHVLDLPANPDNSAGEIELSPQNIKYLQEILDKRINLKKPLPYILGYTYYAHKKYLVTQDTLIPRSPIFEIVDTKFAPYYAKKPKKVLDLCTGAAPIAIHIAKTLKCEVCASDISAKALEVAKKNNALHGTQVTLIQSDMFKSIPKQKFDIIVSNPPYVGKIEMSDLPQEYLHEPDLALRSGVNGLKHVNIILQQAKDYLSDDGILIVEVGNTFKLLSETYPSLPFIWHEFSHGGHGVFILQAKDLI